MARKLINLEEKNFVLIERLLKRKASKRKALF